MQKLNKVPPIIPTNYEQYFYINTSINQTLINKDDCLHQNVKQLLKSKFSYKNLRVVGHEIKNHLNTNQKSKQNSFKYCISFGYRFKTSTYIYYKSKNIKNNSS